MSYEEVPMKLGQSPVEVSTPLGIGTWPWSGDKIGNPYNGSGATSTVVSQQEAFMTSLQHNINFFDTAEVYGMGASELSVGQCLRSKEYLSLVEADPTKEAIIATKFFPLHRFFHSGLGSALRASLGRLGMKKVHLYQLHNALTIRSLDVWSNAAAEMVDEGLLDSVGVSNYNAAQLERAQQVLAQRDTPVPLAVNQIEYSLLHTNPEQQGLLAKCKELGVTVLAYSPLAMGRLSGKYTRENPIASGRRLGGADYDHLEKLLVVMREIGEKHGGKTPAQVAINWCLCKGTLPLVGAKNAEQAADNAGALGWRMDEGDVAELDKLSLPGTQQVFQEKY